MKQIGASTVWQWQGSQHLWSPKSLSAICPYCKEKVTFHVTGTKRELAWESVTSPAYCSACKGKIMVWAVGCLGTVEEVKAGKGMLAIHPHAEEPRQPILGRYHAPERVQRAYQEALDTYNHRIWNATLSSCRRTLEGIVQDQLPADQQKGTLFNQLDKLPDHVDLDKTLLGLTHAVRESGNLGVHFYAEKDADQVVAITAVELIEFFIEYLYAMPHHVEGFREHLKTIDSADAPQTAVDVCGF